MRHDYIRHHLTVHLAAVFHKLTDRQTDGQTNNPTDGHYPRYEFTACDSSVTSVQVKVLCMFFPKFTTPLQHHKTQDSLHITSPLATSLILTEQQNCTVNCSSILLQQTKSCYQPLLTPERFTVVSRIVTFPDGFFPGKTFPGKSFPGWNNFLWLTYRRTPNINNTL